MDAIEKYGIQYPSSRSYVSSTLYKELEELLRQMFNAPVALATTTTLGHQAVLPVVVEEGDVILMDQQVHTSVQYAAMNLQLKGVTVTIVRHNKLDELEKKIQELSSKNKKIWYACDGVYSMYGDCAPMKELVTLLNKYKSLYLYVDDAHGMSWAGKNGTGYVLSQVPLHPKMILATSLNKAFAAGGSVFVIPDEELCDKVNHVGGPLIFAGQHQTSALGASIACAKIHLSPEIYKLQEDLAAKIKYCQQLLESYDLPIISDPHSPIFFVGLGLTRVGYNLVRRMKEDGYFVNIAIFPAVPETCTGVRFTITNHLTLADIKKFALVLAYNFSEALKEEERTITDIHRAFRKVAHFKEDFSSDNKIPEISSSLYILQHETTIENISKELWNDVLGKNGMFDWNGMKFLEDTFKGNKEPENNWDFHYYFVRDKYGKLILATFFTVALIKDDLLASNAVSEQIEKQRMQNPYYLTSKTFMMGSLLTEGEHLYIDRSYNKWKDALMFLLDIVWKEQEKCEASSLYLRDFNAEDIEISNYFMNQGFIKATLPGSNVIENLKWDTKEEFLKQFKHKNRNYIKSQVLKYESLYDVEILKTPSKQEIDHWYKLYKNIKKGSFELNGFNLPKKFFENITKYPNSEVIGLLLKPEYTSNNKRLLVGVTFNFITASNNYAGVIMGIDYNYVKTYNLYKQTLYQSILRASQIKADKIYLGLTTSEVKRKFGAKSIPQVAYVQIKDNYNISLINTIANMVTSSSVVKEKNTIEKEPLIDNKELVENFV